MIALTEKQTRTLGYIREHFERTQALPTYGELAAYWGVTPKQAWDVVRALANKNKIEIVRRPGGRSRYRLVGYAAKLVKVTQ